MSGADPWDFLRRHTEARIALGRSGNALPTDEVLAFQLAHAEARDAVHGRLDVSVLETQLTDAGISLPVVSVASGATDRAEFLQRPDLGRLLDVDADVGQREEWDVVFVLADGLSARAVMENGVATLAAALSHLESWTVAPVVIAEQARVALGDPIGEALGAKLSVMLIGERPGLSAADSLGAYLTFGPRTGRQNADRNCVSNIREKGLMPEEAGHKIAYLLGIARSMGLTGVALKDDAPMRVTGS
ncbi:MAG: ethanolamine ammonia-lyase subunit EutC [Candidatus Phaeomarinobacter sp.]